jgi:hypothetical protein
MNVYSYFTIPTFGRHVTIYCYVILEVCEIIFSTYDGTAVPIPEIPFNTGNFCSVRLPTQGVTFSQRCFGQRLRVLKDVTICSGIAAYFMVFQTIYRPVVGWLVNNELERIWKEAVVI